MGRIITEGEALQRAREYGLEREVARCIHEQLMDPWDALYEWDLLNDSDYGDYDDRSGAEQYVETEYTCYD
jgi:hypothetical protein